MKTSLNDIYGPPLQTRCQVVRCQGLPEKASCASREETYRDRSSLQSPEVVATWRVSAGWHALSAQNSLNVNSLNSCKGALTEVPLGSLCQGRKDALCAPGRGWDWNESRMTVSGNPLQRGLFFFPPLKLSSSFLTSRNASVALNELPKERSERMTSVIVAAPIHLVGHHPVTLARWQIDWH